MLVSWKEVVAVVAVRLWPMLSIAAVVNSYFLRTDEQTTPSSLYLLTATSTSCAETSSIRSYVKLTRCSWTISTKSLFSSFRIA